MKPLEMKPWHSQARVYRAAVYRVLKTGAQTALDLGASRGSTDTGNELAIACFAAIDALVQAAGDNEIISLDSEIAKLKAKR